ncbi:transketolase [Uliginosibacterium sp. 31-16]|uniref:transketolase n=1 Tax=Uliginosibacterium sp. 31-16 TaxID=3068315 RepID=UPI00273E8A64|nr:transketolase [Uliginosibacterium sp. 31-16]MDP5238461.1 transketolase [Uliginosibacterium sp. 31-16]
MNTSAPRIEFSPITGAIRALAMDAVQQANSGHPGMPMGMAEIAEVVWRKNLSHNPANPAWANRDRFVLSNGHGSMLHYALLHLTGYDLPIDELKKFRQLGSKTPGHPEVHYTPGIETTTGPLGQGIANAVGFALAEKMLAAQFNRPGHEIVDHRSWVFLGDGCLMEGISHEVASLAGLWKLGKLTAYYDDNGISIDGEVAGWFADDTKKRFEAYGWQVIGPINGHDTAALEAATAEARADSERPALIICRTTIGAGSPNKAGTADSHGAPLGAAEIAEVRKAIGWEHAPFEIPADIYAAWDAKVAGAAREAAWNDKFAAYAKAFPELAAEFTRRLKGELPAGFAKAAEDFVAKVQAKAETIATRKASQNAIEALAPALPELLGSSADLAGSNLTHWSGSKDFMPGVADANYINYGVREFAEVAIANGMALHGGYIPYTATFLVFSDYCRSAIRMAALMHIRQVMVFTHDSIGVGEDGPTHQPIEHTASLRLIPNLNVWRPCDTTEAAVAWVDGIERADGPTVLALTRQNLPFSARSAQQIADIRKGGYILSDAEGAKAVLIATGSEVGVALAAQKLLAESGLPVRVVSMPCTRLFDLQDAAYKAGVLGKGLPRVAIEAGVSDGWYKYVGLEGAVIGLDRFGESGPGGTLFKHFGFTPERVVEAVTKLV